MVFDITLEDFIVECGHNGSEIIDLHLPEPNKRRGFNLLDVLKVATNRGFAVTPLLLDITSVHSGHHHNVDIEWKMPEPESWRAKLFEKHRMLILHTTIHNHNHAVAYNPGDRRIYDPNGFIYDVSNHLMMSEDVFMVTRHA